MPPSPCPPLAQQLDIFADSDVMLRNDLVHALLRCDAEAGRLAADRLTEQCPGDALLAPAGVLLVTLANAQAASTTQPLVPDLPSVAAARDHLHIGIAPAARAVLGAAAGTAWLQPLWRDWAQRSARLPWQGTRPQDHAAALWLAAGDWAQAAQAAGGIPSWRRIPAPLAWMAEARCREQGVDEAWRLLAERAWLAPAWLDALLRTLEDPLLNRMRRGFEEGFDTGGDLGAQDLAWFPAWALARTPALAPRLALAEPGQGTAPERGLRLMVQQLGLEREGRHHGLMACRKSLRDLCPPLFAAYMATR